MAARRGLASLALLIALAIVFGSPYPWRRVVMADMAYMSRSVSGSGVFPIGTTLVEMVAEEVTIDLLESDQTAVTCVFHFRNNAIEPTEVLMGFPATVSGNTTADFTVSVDGEPFPVALEPAAETQPPGFVNEVVSQWYTFTVTFGAGQERTVTNTYSAPMVSWPSEAGFMDVNYILTTGATWEGPIGKAVITVNLDDYHPAEWSCPGSVDTSRLGRNHL